ncbi:MAG: hypothetical protein EA422_06620 [Gemmatimonadales bacterium]|nr:MAG: hypothetical protein EA422_06620 [Gemmatimonadales bacterium]
MSVGRDEVQRIAALARIRLDDDAADRLDAELTGILAHVDTLMEVDVSEAEEGLVLPPPFHGPDAPPVPDSGSVFRQVELEADALASGAPGDRAPEWSEGFFLVPRLPAVDGTREGGA